MSVKACPSIAEAIKKVRSDTEGDDFCAATHVDGKVDELTLLSSGTGGVEALAATFDPTKIVYGFVRVTDRVDMSDTVKFVFVQCIGESVKPMFRGRVGPYMGSITPIFEPHHVSFHITEPTEFTPEIVQRKVGDASGSRDHTTVRSEGMQERGFLGGRSAVVAAKNHIGGADAGGASAIASPSPQGAAGAGSAASAKDGGGSGGTSGSSSSPAPPQPSRQTVQVAEAVKDAIKALRDDGNTAVDWCLATGNDDGIELADSGAGGIPSLRAAVAALDGDAPSFGLVRTVDVIDGHPTTKFAHVSVVPDSLRPMVRAKLTTRRGIIAEAFHPFHIEITVECADEIDEDAINRLIGSASGSLSHVKEVEPKA
jgi:hypothetical protein